MADSIATIEARLRTEYPTIKVTTDGVERTLNQQEYDTQISTWALAERTIQLARDERAAQRTLRDEVRTALVALDADIVTLNSTAGTLAQTRNMLERTDKVLVGLIRAMIDMRLIERD